MTDDDVFALFDRLALELAAWHRDLRDERVLHAPRPAELEERLARFDLATPRPAEAILDDVLELMKRWTVHVGHPRCFGLFNPGVFPITIVADALVAAFNPQLAVAGHAPAAHAIERRTLATLADAVGWPSSEAAHFTSGGAEANHTAVLVALNRRWPDLRERGLTSLERPLALYTGPEGHDSLVKIARMTGLGGEAVRRVPSGTGRLEPAALRQHTARDREDGREPFCVVATAGSTPSGGIDPLDELADVAAEEGIDLHVDAAWGASYALVPGVRDALAGLDRAASLTWDAHKALSVPMGAGMFFGRDPADLRAVFGLERTGYMPASGAGGDPFETTAQWSRRFIGLKLFMALAHEGLGGIAARLEHQVAMGETLRRLLEERGWRVVNDTPLPVVCFTNDRLTADPSKVGPTVRRLHARGRAWVSPVRLGDGSKVLRACITSYRTVEEDLHVLLDELDSSLP